MVHVSVLVRVHLERERTACECKYPQCRFGACIWAGACVARSVAGMRLSDVRVHECAARQVRC